jgi:hypothetical protein
VRESSIRKFGGLNGTIETKKAELERLKRATRKKQSRLIDEKTHEINIAVQELHDSLDMVAEPEVHVLPVGTQVQVGKVLHQLPPGSNHKPWLTFRKFNGNWGVIEKTAGYGSTSLEGNRATTQLKPDVDGNRAELYRRRLQPDVDGNRAELYYRKPRPDVNGNR